MAKSENTHSTTKARASWAGQLTFGLVSFPVEAFNALDRERSDIHFHQLHAKCHRRINYKKVCPVHGEVAKDEIVSGYEFQKGKYVEVDPDKLGALRNERDRGLHIDAFVKPDVVDPLYFDGRMYYLTPDGSSANEPYCVLVEAMAKEHRCGVGQIDFSGKEQIVLLRPLDGVLHMAMLNYANEIRPANRFASEITKPKTIARQVQLAQTLIEEWTEDGFDFSKYKDDYRAQVEKLINAKMRGREIEAPEEEEPRHVLNLMDALKKSLHSSNRTVRTERRKSKRSA